MAHVTHDELKLCTCCTQVAANADDSGCRDYWGHADHALTALAGLGYVVVTDDAEGHFPTGGMCDGCGIDTEIVAYGAILADGDDNA